MPPPSGKSAKKRLRSGETPFLAVYDDVTPVPQQPKAFELLCLLEGDEDAFSVNVTPEQLITLLKDAIKAKRPNILKDVDASDLQLWKIRMPEEELEKAEPSIEKLEKLRNTKKISHYWKDDALADQTVIHIFVAKPSLPPLPSVAIDRVNTSLGTPIPVFPHVNIFTEESDLNFVHLYNMFWKSDSYSACFETREIAVPDVNTLDLDSVVKTKHTFDVLTLKTEPKGVFFPFSSKRDIVVTPNYGILLEKILKTDEEWCLTGEEAPENISTVIVGQPGIGKTVFLDFLLVHRLRHKLPTIFCNKAGLVHIFTESGVRKVKLADDPKIEELQNPGCSILINISDNLMQPPSRFHPIERNARAVVATSPNPAHLSNFSKERMTERFILPLWDWTTLYGAAVIMHPRRAENFDKQLRKAFFMLQGIPRRCFYIFRRELWTRHLDDITHAVASISDFEGFVKSIIHGRGLPFSDKASHLLARLKPIDDTWVLGETSLLSEYISGLIFERMKRHDVTQVSRSITNLLSELGARGYAGGVFEKVGHYTFREGVMINAQPLTPGAPPLTFSITPDDKRIDCYYQNLSDIRAFSGSHSVHADYLERYLILTSKTAESIDSLYITRDITYMFQFTVSPKHPLKLHGIRSIVDLLPAKAKGKIVIIFVVPKGDAATKNYKVQTIKIPTGSNLVGYNYPQYVYYFDYSSFGATQSTQNPSTPQL